MAESAPQHEPKLSEFDIIVTTVLLASLDAADWFELGIPATDLLGFPLEQLFLSKKGVKGTTAFVGNLLELVPFADYLPIRTLAFLVTAWADHHPDEALAQKLEQAGQATQSLKGKGGGASGAAGAKGTLQTEEGAAKGGRAATSGTKAGGAAQEAGAAEGTVEGGVGETAAGAAPGRRGRSAGGRPGYQAGEEEGEAAAAEEKASKEQLELEEAATGKGTVERLREEYLGEGYFEDIEAEASGSNTATGKRPKGIMDEERMDKAA